MAKHPIVMLMHDLIASVRLLNEQLLQDKLWFKQNDLQAIDESNIEKSVLNAQIQQISEKLLQQPELTALSGTLFQRILSVAKNSPHLQQEISEQLAHFQSESDITYERMHANRNVVSSNITYVRGLVDQLVQNNRKQPTDVYDGTGTIL